MERSPIAIQDFRFDSGSIGKRWMLLAAGNYAQGHYNAMTISWGSAGQVWNRPFFQVLVRPTRHTMQFMESGDSFTLSILPPELLPALNYLGSTSGRDGDKITASGLHATASSVVAAPSFAEAELVVECRTMYWQDLDPAHFLDPAIEENYPRKDYHRIYFGQILAVSGTESWRFA